MFKNWGPKKKKKVLFCLSPQSSSFLFLLSDSDWMKFFYMSFCKGREEIRSANLFSSGFMRTFASWNVWLLQPHLQTAIPPTSQKPLQIVVLYKAAIQMMHRLSMTCPWPIPAPHNISPIAFPTREYISAVRFQSLLTCPSPLTKQGNMIGRMRYLPDSQDACTFPWAHTQRSWHHWKICHSCASISSSKNGRYSEICVYVERVEKV